MKLGMQVGLGSGHIVLDGDAATPPQFSAHICCGQMAAWIKMPLGMEVGLNQGDFVLDGDPAPLPKNWWCHPIFDARLLWPNGCMDQNATWYGGRPRPTRHCVRWGTYSPPLKRHRPQFSANVLRRGQTARWTKMPPWYGGRLRPGQLYVRWGPNYPQKKMAHPVLPNFWPISIVAKRLDG